MSRYFSTDSITIQNFTEDNINSKYNNGFVFTRMHKGNLNQTRSLRINLAKFELTSENRRVLNKNESLELSVLELPLKNYNWKIHQLGKEFYSRKFADHIMSASKIKQIFNNNEKSNMNYVFEYRILAEAIGYSLGYINKDIVHYAYPFYNLNIEKAQNIGMAMMIKAINWSKNNLKSYCYLGSVVEDKSKYKLQFKGVEWWDNELKVWSEDIEELKQLLTVL